MKNLLFILFVISSNGAWAVDGVIEINQACAVNTGCFSGDVAGFPIQIDGTAGSSYILTSNLNLANINNNTHGIVIETSDIEINLNGFSIIGANCANDVNVNCLPATGSARGIFTLISIAKQVSVTNGNIVGMGSNAIHLGNQSKVSDLLIRWCGSGIQVGAGSVVESNTVIATEANGISSFGNNIRVVDNTIINNAMDGIRLDTNYNFISHNIVAENGSIGIKVNDYNTITNNQVNLNQSQGILIRNNSHVADNSISSNLINGVFSLGNHNKILQNTIIDNGSLGINMPGSTSVYQNNYMHNNTLGSVSLSITNLGGNFCHDQICP